MEELLTPKELKRILKCSLPYTYKLASSGLLPCIRISGISEPGKRAKDMVRFKLSDVQKFIDSHYRGN